MREGDPLIITVSVASLGTLLCYLLLVTTLNKDDSCTLFSFSSNSGRSNYFVVSDRGRTVDETVQQDSMLEKSFLFDGFDYSGSMLSSKLWDAHTLDKNSANNPKTLSHKENDLKELAKLARPFTVLKNDLRFNGLDYKLIQDSVVRKGSLYTEPISFIDRVLGVTLLTVIRGDEHLSNTIITNWRGNIIVVIWAPADFASTLQSSIIARGFPPRVSVILITYKKSNAYSNTFPINMLRDVGLRAVTTSHVLVLDNDVTVPGALWESISNLPRWVIMGDQFVVLIPTVFLEKGNVPNTMKELRTCLDRSQCSLQRKGYKTYNYVDESWISHTTSSVRTIKCLGNTEMEPYYFIKLTATMPYYFDSFVDYGFDRISHFEELRLQGYQMFILQNGFVVHEPHAMSMRRLYFNLEYLEREQASSEALYLRLQQYWMQRYNHSSFVPICESGKTTCMYFCLL